MLFSQAPDGLSDIVVAGRDRRTVRTVGQQPQGYAWSASNSRWIAFVGGNEPGVSDYNHWTMWLWDSRTGTLRAVARNPVDARGRALPGYYVLPVLTDNYLYWIQAAPDIRHLSDTGAGSEVVQYDLATGRKRVLYDGVAAAVRPYRGSVLFTAVPPGPKTGHIVAASGNRNMVVRAVDEQTGKEVPAPKGLTAGRDGAFTMVSNGDLVAWNRWQGGIAAWRPSWGKTLLLSQDDGGPGGLRDLVGADSLGLYRQFLIFRAAGRQWVLDLRTDSIAALTPHVGRVAFGAGHYLSIWQSNGPNGANTMKYGYTASLIDLAKLPDLPGCPVK